jgi:hypothetical protein
LSALRWRAQAPEESGSPEVAALALPWFEEPQRVGQEFPTALELKLPVAGQKVAQF